MPMQPDEMMDGPSKAAVAALAEALSAPLSQELTAKALSVLKPALAQAKDAQRQAMDRQNALEQRLLDALEELSRLRETEQRTFAEEMRNLKETAQRAAAEKARLEKRLAEVEQANAALAEQIKFLRDRTATQARIESLANENAQPK